MIQLELEEPVPVSRTKKPRRGRPRILGIALSTPPPSVPPSLPPGAPETALVPSVITESSPEARTKPSWYLPEDSKIRPVAEKIMQMRIAGIEDAEIAKALGISEKSVHPYVYRASKNGWLKEFTSAKDEIAYRLIHKVVSNLEEGLDDNVRHNTSGMRVKTAVALKMAEGTLFKQFDQAPGATSTTIVAVKVEMPPGPRQEIREDTTGGVPAFVDVEVVK